MASSPGVTLKVRKSFTVAQKAFNNWFPGHMHKGMRQMQQRLKSVDCIIEVHDARIPFSGRNPNFLHTLTAIKPHILVLNKADLIDQSLKPAILRKFSNQNMQDVIFTNCKEQQDKGVNSIVPRIVDLLKNTKRYHRNEVYSYNLLIIGVPNVGKSSLINVLRNVNLHKGKATIVGALAGVTRSVLEKIKVSEIPPIYLYDTPGVLAPNLKDIETALRLALCATFRDHLVGEQLIADYLLYWMNTHKNFSYVDYLGIPEPCDNITTVLFLAAMSMKQFLKVRSPEGSMKYVPNVTVSATHFIQGFRQGAFGQILLDDDILLSRT